MNSDGSNSVMLSQQRYCENPVWSPDGSKILYDADDDLDGWQELWVMNADGTLQSLQADMGGTYVILANGWSPDNAWVTHTGVHLINYYGNWYWDRAYLYKRELYTGNHTIINSGRSTDWNVDWTTSDNQPPTTKMSAPASPVPYQFTVSWSGQDGGSGLVSYDVQVSDVAGGVWTDWQMGTTDTAASFTGVGGHTYYFRSRARDNAFNLQPWPANYQVSVTVESAPPTTRVDSLQVFTRGNQVTLTWKGYDTGDSGISGFDIQYKDDYSGVWESFLTNTISTTALFTGELGHTFRFRSRGTDYARNVEAWSGEAGDTSTTFFSWMTSGTVGDNTGVPVAGMQLTINPQAFLNYPSNTEGKYSVYLVENPEVKTVIWAKSEYGELPPTNYGLPDASVDVILPPTENIIQDWGFENGTLTATWLAGGTFTPTLEGTYFHSGKFAASIGTSPQFGDPVCMGNLSSIVDTYNPFAIDSQGGLHIAWPDWDNGYHINYAYKSPGGTWSALEIAAQTEFIVPAVRIMVDDKQVVHMVYQVDYSNSVYYTWRDPNGIWSTPELVYSGGWYEKVIIDDNNTIHVLITTGSNLVYAHYIIGENWQLEYLTAAQWVTKPSMAVDSQGRVYLVWTLK